MPGLIERIRTPFDTSTCHFDSSPQRFASSDGDARMAVGVAAPEEGDADAAGLGGGAAGEAPLVAAAAGKEEPPPEGRVPAAVVEEGKGAAAAPVEGAPAVITVEGKEESHRSEVTNEAEKAAAAAAEEEEEGGEGEKRLGHYSSLQSILIVGDGDFSFSLALATAFGSGENLVATSLDTYDDLKRKYSKAESNIMELKRLGATVIHGVDVNKMRFHTDLKNNRFDRIIFNFPHAGFKGKEDDMHMINSHRQLVWGFFSNARHLVRRYGEIHVTHKTGLPYDRWNLEHLASEASLAMIDKVLFQKNDYPGYNQKRGDSKRCDEPFDLGVCYTFKFQIGDLKKLKKMNGNKAGSIPNLGGSSVHPGHWVTDRGQFHQPLPPVEALPWQHFPPPANTGGMLMPPQPYIVDQWQQPGFPLNSDGIVGEPYFHQQDNFHPMVNMLGPWLNDLLTPGGIPPPQPMFRQLNGLPAPGGIPPPQPMGRIPHPDLLAPQEQPWYQQRTVPDQLGGDNYFFAREHQSSLQREYEMQRQIVPGSTGLNHSAFLENRRRDRESVQREEWLRRMIDLYGKP
ncbi:hypothetical protein U9M48_014712 [Paspalum notatum var. saurae]|uniref:25S rRNA (uridine-N(3))-methyltransferase BMT5-like domain-containing protein n=1 Tax=Paspalum notatum var. saurae TaxID=547442 RepID=A0AAQ3WL39_PASNO